jgi:hypothetical protein
VHRNKVHALSYAVDDIHNCVVVRGHLSISLLPLSSPTCLYVLHLLTSVLSPGITLKDR